MEGACIFAEFLSPLSTVFLLHRAPLPPQSAPAPHRLPNLVRSIICEFSRHLPKERPLCHYKSCGKPGLLLRRKFPCFCSACLNDDSENCPNGSWSGKWEEVAVTAKYNGSTRVLVPSY